MIEIKTNPIITISETDIHTLKVICGMARQWMSYKCEVAVTHKNYLSDRLGISVTELSFIKSMLDKIEKIDNI